MLKIRKIIDEIKELKGKTLPVLVFDTKGNQYIIGNEKYIYDGVWFQKLLLGTQPRTFSEELRNDFEFEAEDDEWDDNSYVSRMGRLGELEFVFADEPCEPETTDTKQIIAIGKDETALYLFVK